MGNEASRLDTQPPLSGCWYLADHWDRDTGRRTRIGDLVYRAKPAPGRPGHPDAAHSLASMIGRAACTIATKRPYPLAGVKLAVPVPTFPPEEPRNLPDILALYLAGGVGATYDNQLLTKTLETPDLHAPDEIRTFVSKAYRVNRALHGERILLVDDMVGSAETLRTIAELLIAAGAGEVGAFVATRIDAATGILRRPA